MRPWLLCAALAAAVFIVSPAAAQTGTFCLYADPQGTQCSLSDPAPGVLPVYVIHSPLSTPSGGAIGSYFAAPKPDCMVGATWIGDGTQFSIFGGDSQVGIRLGYNGCITAPTHVLTIHYMVSGTSASDCPYAVVPAADRGIVEVLTCYEGSVQGVGGISYVNSTMPCECSEPSGPPALSVWPSAIDFGSTERWQTLSVRNDGGGVLTWELTEFESWLQASPVAGTGGAAVTLEASRYGLTVGTYTTEVLVASNAGSHRVHVSMQVDQALWVSPAEIYFGTLGTQEILQVRNRGTESISWSVSSDRPWLSAVPTTGVDDQDVRISVNRSGLASGPYTGTITVRAGAEIARVSVYMSVAPGQSTAGTIGIFSDPQASGCNLYDQGPGLFTAYVVHVLTSGAGASQFGAPVPPCMPNVTYLGETSVFPVTIGTTQTGVSIGYGACHSGTIQLLTIRFFGMGLSEPCCVYPVVPDWQHGQTEIKMVDCTSHELVAGGAHAIVNPNSTCQCGSVRTEEATWGKIKSMYSDE